MKILEQNTDLTRFAKSKIGMKKGTTVPKASVMEETSENMKLLYECQRYWTSLYNFRARRIRARKYYRGDQWSDKVRDPKTGEWLTEEEYLSRQGRVPLKQNRIRQLGKNLIGQFLQNHAQSIVLTRRKADAEVTEMLTDALQYVGQTNELEILDPRCFEEFMLSGLPIQKVGYEYIRERNMEDVVIDNICPDNMFFNTDIRDPRLKDLRLIGEIIDTTVDDIVSTFAKGRKDEERIRSLYAYIPKDLVDTVSDMTGRANSVRDFFVPNDINKARLFEIWTLEGSWKTYVHDPIDIDHPYTVSDISIKEVEALNAERVEMGLSQGMELDEIPLMEAEERYEEQWKVRYLTPTGNLLYEGYSPYAHEEHPYIMSPYPMVDGEVWGFVEDIIDQQKYINRLIVLQDMIINASAKGVLLIPEDTLGGHSPEEFAEEWTKFNGVIVYKPSMVHGQMPQQVSANSTQIGITELLAMQMTLIQDISGVHNAIQGITPNAGTPANRYALETQNASLNTADLMNVFASFRRKRDYKALKTLVQFYKEERYLAINGRKLKENSRLYKPSLVENMPFDVVVAEGVATPVFRQIMDDTLFQLLQGQLIDVEQYLENTSMPFADSLLASIRQKRQEMQENPQGQLSQMDPNLMAQIQEQADPKAMELAQKAMGVDVDRIAATATELPEQ